MAKFSTPLVLSIIMTSILVTGCTNSQLQLKEVIDGDTIILQDGRTIRLLQIDTPEIAEGECYSQEAKLELISILATPETRKASSFKGEVGNSTLGVKKDSMSEDKDQYDRELRYLFFNNMNVNIELVRRGAAAPYFYKGQMGDYSEELLLAVELAKANKIGLWGSCANTILDPTVGIATGFSSSSSSHGSLIASNESNCDPNYRGCIPIFPPDLDCADIRSMGLAPVYRISGDPHGLDRDGDGIGCELG